MMSHVTPQTHSPLEFCELLLVSSKWFCALLSTRRLKVFSAGKRQRGGHDMAQGMVSLSVRAEWAGGPWSSENVCLGGRGMEREGVTCPRTHW